METWKHLRAILLLPFLVTLVILGVLLWLTGPDTLGVWQSLHATRVALPILCGALICLGLVLMVATIQLFVTVGKGTLAPWNPPQRLVVQGVYRHVRNPKKFVYLKWKRSDENPAPAMKVWDRRTGETIPLYRFPDAKNPLLVIPS